MANNINNKTEEEKIDERNWNIALIAIISLSLVIILIFYLSRSARNKVFKPRVARPNAQGVPKIRRNPIQRPAYRPAYRQAYRPRPAAQRINYGY